MPNFQNHNLKGVVFPTTIANETWEIYWTAEIKENVNKDG